MTELVEKFANHTESKSEGGRISVEWITRVLCAAPNASGRALAAAFHLVVGSDRNLVGRKKIGDIRSAFLEMWEELVYTNARDFIVSQLQERAATQDAAASSTPQADSATPQAAPVFLSFNFAHVQDEAELRLLSEIAAPGSKGARRSRTTKVQLNVVTLRVLGAVWKLPNELEGLVDKTGETLATCFERLVNKWLDKLVPDPPQAVGCQPRAPPKEIWVVHCLIGDGIATNEKAAKILWAAVGERRTVRGRTVRYFLIVGEVRDDHPFQPVG